jgi:peptidoglycan/LPS O-acetylase OafA/YrhL
MSSSKLSYRPEVDGLRAIAVVSIIFYHAQISVWKELFQGGYIGVDIFFVISGYLITRIILTELQEQGSFNFLNFYERRARRLLPMLFVVIFVSIPYAWKWLLPLDLVEYAQSILASLFFSSNFFFYFSTIEYGADSALLKPFLHTWSLGVEEQFYLVFPILAFKSFRKHFLTILVGVSLLSLYFANLMEVRNSDLNFYLPISRFWELGSGCLLAYRELNHKPTINTKLSTVGLLLVVSAILFFDGSTPHPSFHTIIPILGVALIIGFASKDEPVGKVLGSKPFVLVGLISYSAYLWHFPIFAFSRIASKGPSDYDKFEWIVLTLVLAIISYHLVERPFRSKRRVSNLRAYFALTIFAVTITLLALYAVQTKGIPRRLPHFLQSDLLEKPWEFNKNNEGKLCYGLHGKSDFCTFGEVDAEKNLYVIGDSNMESISHAIIDLAGPRNYRTTLMNSSACYFVPHSYSTTSEGTERVNPSEPCGVEFQKMRLKKLSQTSSNIVVIGGMLDVYLRNNSLNFQSTNLLSVEDNIAANIKQLTDNGTRVVIIYPYPRPAKHMGKYVLRRKFKNIPSDIPSLNRKLAEMTVATSYSTGKFMEFSKEAFRLLDTIQSANIVRVYPHKLFCKDICKFMGHSGLYLMDRSHPSSYMSKLMTELIFDAIESRGW